MTLEQFARMHRLGREWIELRRGCNRIAALPEYWYRKELQETAREMAVNASDILAASILDKSHLSQ